LITSPEAEGKFCTLFTVLKYYWHRAVAHKPYFLGSLKGGSKKNLTDGLGMREKEILSTLTWEASTYCEQYWLKMGSVVFPGQSLHRGSFLSTSVYRHS
jgi:hypothetical protein